MGEQKTGFWGVFGGRVEASKNKKNRPKRPFVRKLYKMAIFARSLKNYLVVFSAKLKFNSKKLKKIFNAKSLRFAEINEVKEITVNKLLK